MQLRLEKVLRAKDVVWVFGHRIEAVLGAWLATDAGCQVVHVDSVKVSAGQRSTTPLEEAQRAVELGQAAEPRVAVNISGSPNGERLLLKALPVNGVLVTPFDAGPHALARERVPMPWAPNAGELQRAIQLLAAWSVHRDLNACLASPVPPSRFQEALLAVPFKLPSIGCREERP